MSTGDIVNIEIENGITNDKGIYWHLHGTRGYFTKDIFARQLPKMDDY